MINLSTLIAGGEAHTAALDPMAAELSLLLEGRGRRGVVTALQSRVMDHRGACFPTETAAAALGAMAVRRFG
jgi:hypothetical protein